MLGNALSVFVTVVVALAPALIMTTRSYGSAFMYGLLLIALIGMGVMRYRRQPVWPEWRVWRPFMLAAAAAVAIVLIAQWTHGRWHAATFEKTMRLACMVPMLWLFSRLNPAILRHIQWGFLAGALYCTFLLAFPDVTFTAVNGRLRPDTLAYTEYNTVEFGNLAFLYACVCVVSLMWTLTRWPKLEAALKLSVAALGFYGVYLSETRTSWLALPAVFIIACVVERRISWRIKAVVCALLVAIVTVIGVTHQHNDRIGKAIDEAQECVERPKAETSVCIRFQLWRAARVMIEKHPVFGVGGGPAFREKMKILGDRGVISPLVASNWGEPHNDILLVAATYGLVGLASFLLMVYGIPAWILASRIRDLDQTRRAFCALGLCVVLGFLSFGITETMFRSMRTASFYAVMVSLCLAMAVSHIGQNNRRVHPA
jgi:O-antigen ligase